MSGPTCKSCVGSREGALAVARCTSTCTLLAMSPSTACAIPAPQQLEDIPWNSAKLSHNRVLKPGSALFDQLLSRGESGIAEVALETARTSKTYRAKLEAALAQLLLWVSTTIWAAVDWM